MKKQQDPPEQQDVTFPKAQTKQNVVSIETAKQSSKVVLLEPRTYSEAQGIADHLKGRRAVVIYNECLRIKLYVSLTFKWYCIRYRRDIQK